MIARRLPTLRPGEVVELLGAAGVELERDVRPFHLRCRPHQRVGDDVAGHQRLRLHEILGAVRHAPIDACRRRRRSESACPAAAASVAGRCSSSASATSRQQLELQHRGPADQILGALRILDAGQLDEDVLRRPARWMIGSVTPNWSMRLRMVSSDCSRANSRRRCSSRLVSASWNVALPSCGAGVLRSSGWGSAP